MSPKYHFLEIEIDDLTPLEAAEHILRMLVAGDRGYVVTPNAAHVCRLQGDPQFRAAYSNAGLVLPDSAWLVVAARLAGIPLRGRCVGTDVLPHVLAVAQNLGKGVFLLGGTLGSEKIAAEKIRCEYSIPVSTYSPPLGFERDPEECERIVRAINASGAQLLFVHAGAPKSEVWLHNHFSKLRVTVACSFGAALDYYAGTRRRAPAWLRRLGLEWFFRFCQEPRRLWKRYTIGNLRFIGIAALEIARQRLGSVAS